MDVRNSKTHENTEKNQGAGYRKTKEKQGSDKICKKIRNKIDFPY